ncbi:MAG TPA: hypothetical protein VFG72_16765 [Marmoricola sp.]|nr:hypothetical protein [Marmoricola sp.]
MARFVIVVLLFAGVVYALLWALERRRAAGGRTGGRGSGRTVRRPKPQTRQVAPDDDEDFLRWLERKQRKDRKKDPDGPE